MGPIKIGILGTAGFAKRIILPALSKLNEYFSIEAISSRDLRKAQELSELYRAKPFGSYNELIEAKCCDAVYIPLPNSLHFEYIIKCLEKGINVFVEKPLACSLYEVEEVTKLAKSSGLVVLENFHFRFHRQLEVITKILKSGTLGEIRSLRSSFCFPPFPDGEKNIRYQKDLGGGALLDAGTYPIKISQYILKEPLTVEAASCWIDSNLKVDIWGGGYLESKTSNAFSQIVFGFDNFYQCNIEILGSKGKLYTNRVFTAKPDHKVEIELETASGRQKIEVKPDNAYGKILLHFYSLIFNNNLAEIEREHQENLSQATLIQEFKILANASK